MLISLVILHILHGYFQNYRTENVVFFSFSFNYSPHILLLDRNHNYNFFELQYIISTHENHVWPSISAFIVDQNVMNRVVIRKVNTLSHTHTHTHTNKAQHLIILSKKKI